MPNVVGFLKKAFPFISAAAQFGGPLGVLASKAVGQALGLDKPPEPTADAVATAIAGATPEQLIALKQIDADVKTKLAALGFQNVEDLESIAAKDRADARARQVAMRDNLPAVLAVSVTFGFFGLLWLVATRGVNAQAHDVIITMVGTLGTAWVGVVTYYFGSSAGSARKTELLSQNGK